MSVGVSHGQGLLVVNRVAAGRPSHRHLTTSRRSRISVHERPHLREGASPGLAGGTVKTNDAFLTEEGAVVQS